MHPTSRQPRHNRATTLPPWATTADRLDYARMRLLWALALLAPYLLAGVMLAGIVATGAAPLGDARGWGIGVLWGGGLAVLLWACKVPKVALGCAGVLGFVWFMDWASYRSFP